MRRDFLTPLVHMPEPQVPGANEVQVLRNLAGCFENGISTDRYRLKVLFAPKAVFRWEGRRRLNESNQLVVEGIHGHYLKKNS